MNDPNETEDDFKKRGEEMEEVVRQGDSDPTRPRVPAGPRYDRGQDPDYIISIDSAMDDPDQMNYLLDQGVLNVTDYENEVDREADQNEEEEEEG